MPEIPFRYIYVRQALAAGNDLCSLLARPQFCRIVEQDLAPSAPMVDKTSEILKELPPYTLVADTFPDQINVDSTMIRIDAPKLSTGWESAFEYTVHYVWWQLDSRYKIAWVPGIDVKAIAVGAGEIEHEVRREIKNSLTRNRATTQLDRLSALSRFCELQVLQYNDVVDIPTPRQVADESKRPDKKSTLKSIARKMRRKLLGHAWLVEDEIKQLAEKLSGRRPESVLLIGPSGSGKTAVFEQLVQTAKQHEMSEFEFWQTDGSRLIAGMSGFGQWQQRCTELVNELEKKQAIIHFGNLVELIETGKGGSIRQGIADFLRPFLVRGKITAVVECTEEQLSIVAKRSPQMLDAFHQIKLKPADARKTGEILLEIAAHEMTDPRNTVDPAAITAINQLHARYATYSAMPGRAVRFFRNLVEDVQDGQTIDADCVTDAFANETGLPRFLLHDSVPLDLEKTRDWFAERIIGQPEPVDLVVDLLAVVKSNLNRPGRPIASLMFIGPTGVGKTQMAKALAEFMYRDEKKMVRFDMSEYKDPYSAARLIGGFGDGEGLLTGKVRENPFTVVLLDEFEKAHASVFDLFLQVLGEGRLTDGHGRLVDFSTCVIIITSNLGVESFRESGLGFGGSSDQATNYQEHFIRQVQKHVRPEFFNRIDRVVPFAPLEMDAVVEIAKRELQLLQRRYGIENRDVEFKIHKSAPQILAELGYNPRYGARPLKRAINQRLVQPLSCQLIRKPFNAPLKVNVHAQKTGIHFSLDPVEQTRSNAKERQALENVIYELSKTRRRAQALGSSPMVNRLRNQIYRQQQSLDRALRRHKPSLRDEKLYANPELLKRYTSIEEDSLLVQRIEKRLNDLMDFERGIVNQFLEHQPIDIPAMVDRTKTENIQIEHLILELFLNETDSSKHVTLTLYSRHPAQMQMLLDGWEKVAEQFEFNTEVFELRRHDKELDDTEKTPPVYRLSFAKDSNNHPGNAVDVFRGISDEPPKDLLGYSIVIAGRGAFQIFFPEQGLHRFRQEGHRDVLVVGSGKHVRNTFPPKGIEQLPKFDTATTRRTIDLNSKQINDAKHGTYHFEKSDLTTTLVTIVNDHFQALLNERIDTWN